MLKLGMKLKMEFFTFNTDEENMQHVIDENSFSSEPLISLILELKELSALEKEKIGDF
jgi:hypothetical protein